jgi:hypothetical protein
MRKDIAGSVFTFILVGNEAVTSSEAIVTMTLMVETCTIRTRRAIFTNTVVCVEKKKVALINEC